MGERGSEAVEASRAVIAEAEEGIRRAEAMIAEGVELLRRSRELLRQGHQAAGAPEPGAGG